MDSEQYIGVKIIEAIPMTAEEAGEVLDRPINTENAESEYANTQDENTAVLVHPGYFVKYPDGYTSWSPKKQFEEAYRKTNGLTFGLAIEALKKGLKVTRAGWNGKGLYLELQRPTELSKMTQPYLYLNCPKGSTNHFGKQVNDIDRVPWLAGQTDVLADDWQIVE